MKEVSLDHWTTLFLLAAVQGLFLSTLLFLHKKGNTKATRLLALLILFFSLMLTYYVAFWTGFAIKFRWVNGWTGPLIFLFGPLAYFYMKELRENSKVKMVWMHFIPFMAHAVWTIPFLVRNIFGRIEFLRTNFFLHASFIQYVNLGWIILSNISLLGYAVMMHRSLYLDRESLTKFSLPEERIKYRWLVKLVWFYTGFAAAFASYWILAWTGLLELKYDYMISIAMSSFIYMVGYLGFRQPVIFHPDLFNNGKKVFPKYARSSLKEDESKALLDRLLAVMDTEKPYLNSELNIQQLADRVGISTHHLSQVINEKLNQKYPEFINTYRINEAKRLLLSPGYEKEKILTIAFDSGFHNKATFNTTFRKYTGMAPSEYKQYHQRILAN